MRRNVLAARNAYQRALWSHRMDKQAKKPIICKQCGACVQLVHMNA